MSRFTVENVIYELRAFENDYNDELEAYVGVTDVQYDDNGNAVATVIFTPVVEDEEEDFRVADDQAERFKVKVFRL